MLLTLTLAIAAAMCGLALAVRSTLRFRARCRRWAAGVDEALERGQQAHARLVELVTVLDRRVPKRSHTPAEPFPLSRPASSWSEEDHETRELVRPETYGPVDFRHDDW